MKQTWRIICAAIAMALAHAAVHAADQPAPALSAAAVAALKQAEEDINQAAAGKNVWTTARAALDAAKRAAANGDADAVVRNARAASARARLSIEQTHYPTVE